MTFVPISPVTVVMPLFETGPLPENNAKQAEDARPGAAGPVSTGRTDQRKSTI